MKKVLASLSLLLSLLIVGTLFIGPAEQTSYVPLTLAPLTSTANQIDMPIVTDHPLSYLASNMAPVEQRDITVRKWLAVSLKISVEGGSGSGTIVYFDPKDGYAYMQSCGHLWSHGEMTAEQGKTRKLRCKVTTWYKNMVKLDSPQSYDAEVIYYSYERGRDVSLLRFKPDWVPEFFPIAPEDIPLPKGMRLHSCGADGGREVAHYDVKVVGEEPASMAFFQGGRFLYAKSAYMDLITTENSPRPGRSGGGLMTDEYYVGICWGTSDKSGNGIGLFTPLSTLRAFNEKNGYGWLNKIQASPARTIPIVDRNGQQRTYPKDYIPLPNGR